MSLKRVALEIADRFQERNRKQVEDTVYKVLSQNRQRLLQCAAQGMKFVTFTSSEAQLLDGQFSYRTEFEGVEVTVTPLMTDFPTVGITITASWR
jgi:hypothetical protein